MSLMWASNKHKNGFTIVELLIVIVVIGILAAITIVAFNGVQNRAKNQQTVSAVRSYYEAIASHGVKNSKLPAGRTCIGPAEFYDSNPCYIGASTYNWTATLNDSLNDSISSRPATAKGSVTGSGVTASGIFYDNATGESATGYLGFPIFGASTCPVIAGADVYGTSPTSMGADVYCRIKTPTF